ncbi:SPOR domain-containing protein [Hoeflea sp.]|uniref:SPOR domain-containing protein n=1 Tax=Hoeflea sp. TaxID=1940281 RepID=UPI003B0128EC
MADNRISETREPADKDQKDNDPLAELARIVGFEEEGNKTADDDSTSVQADSGFDLEAELMRELEIDVNTGESASGNAVFEQPAAAEEPVQQDAQPTASQQMSEKVTPIQPELETGEAAGATDDWPHATVGAAAQMTSLEAELQAAFSALEGRAARPEPVPEPAPAPEPIVEPEPTPEPAVEPEPVQVQPATSETPAGEVRMPAASAAPIESISESFQLKEAYDRLQKDIEAAKPEADAPVNDGNALTEMLLAEMAEVESQANEAAADANTIPFDPAGIAETDSAPEAIANLSVPEYSEQSAPEPDPKDNNFGLPLEDELDELTSPEPIEVAAAARAQRPAPVDHADPSLEPTAFETAAAFGDAADQSARHEYDDDPGMDDYQDDYETDVFPGDDFTVDDLAAPGFDDMADDQGERSGRRGLVAAAVVLGIAVVGGGGFYLWNSSLGGDSASDSPLIIAADNDPVKVKPEDPGGKTVPNQDLAVYDKVAGNESSTTPEQNLVTTTEEPVDVVQRTLDPETLPLEGRSDPVEPAVKSEERLTASQQLDPDPAASDADANGVAPRKVRTLVVKPDGTIVAREEPAAAAAPAGNATASQDTTAATQNDLTAGAIDANGAAEAPVAVASALPSATQSTTDNQAAAGQSAALPPIDENLRDTGALPLPVNRPEAADAQTTEVASATTTNNSDLRAAVAAPVPETRPAEQPVTIVEAVTERGNLAGTTTAANPGGYMMQISSQPSEEAARQSYQNLSQRYASIIGGRGVDFQRADIPNRGVFYRVRIPAGSKDDANSLCARYKAAGGSCFVAR